MSNPTHPTRQQLDDLEALMQRMLALPVNQLDDDLGTASSLVSAPEWESLPEEPPLLPERPVALSMSKSEYQEPAAAASVVEPERPTAVERREEKEPEAAASVVEPERPISRPSPPVAREEIAREKESPAAAPLPASPRTAVPLPARGRMVLADRPRRLPSDRPGWWLRVLLGSNRVFDRYAGRMGGLGRWLRGRFGRAVLGLTGLLLLAAAVALGVLDWIGWTW